MNNNKVIKPFMKKLIFILLALLITTLIYVVYKVNVKRIDFIEVSGGSGDAVQYLSKIDNNILKKAISDGDVKQCLKIQERESMYAFNQYNKCIEGVAKKTKDVSLCKTYFRNTMRIDSCIWYVAVESADENICKTASHNYVDCHDSVMRQKAISTGDLNYCLKQVSVDRNIKYRCIQMYAKDPAQCKEFFDKINPRDDEMYNMYINTCPEKS